MDGSVEVVLTGGKKMKSKTIYNISFFVMLLGASIILPLGIVYLAKIKETNVYFTTIKIPHDDWFNPKWGIRLQDDWFIDNKTYTTRDLMGRWI